MKIPCTLRFVPSLLLGLCFLFSGGLKGIDPYGTSLKLGEYFRVWGWDGFVADHALVWSVWLCAGELCLGMSGEENVVEINCPALQGDEPRSGAAIMAVLYAMRGGDNAPFALHAE